MTSAASHTAWGLHAPALAANGLVLTAYRTDDAETILVMDRDPEIARRFGWAVEEHGRCAVGRRPAIGAGARVSALAGAARALYLTVCHTE